MSKSQSYKAAADYDTKSSHVQEQMYKQLLSLVEIKEGFKCVDIGCGTGKNSAYLAELVGRKGHVVAIDPDQKRIEYAKENYQKENLEFKVARSVDIPYLEGGYDFAISNVVMHWVELEEKKETYRKLFDLLKPGAILVLSENPFIPDFANAAVSFCSPDTREKLQLTPSYFIDLEQSVGIFASLGYEIISKEKRQDVHKIPSLDIFFSLLNATFHGLVDFKEIYEQNQNAIPLSMNENGEVLIKSRLSVIAVRKPK